MNNPAITTYDENGAQKFREAALEGDLQWYVEKFGIVNAIGLLRDICEQRLADLEYTKAESEDHQDKLQREADDWRDAGIALEECGAKVDLRYGNR